MRSIWLALPLITLAACQGQLDGSAASPSASGGGSGSGASAGSSSVATFNLSCSAPALGSPVLRLLNGREFTNTMLTVFPQALPANPAATPPVAGWTSTLPADPVSAYGFDNDSSAQVGPQLAQAFLDTAKSVASSVTGDALAAILPCAASSADRTCADTFIKQYGRRLFRRTLSAAEENQYLAYFDAELPKSDFKTTIKWLTVGLIQSPYAVYRSEIGAPASDGTRNLSQTEIATELAYTYTGTAPTDALITQAETGTLGDPAQMATMLTPDVMQHFFEGYLGYPQVGSIERDITAFDSVKNDMIQETRGFINDTVIANLGGLKELLTANVTNPSPALAAYYQNNAPNFPMQAGAADANNGLFPPVTRPVGLGIGILAQGSILASRALPNGSSPTQRGLLVFSNMLCETKPSPPAGVPPIGQPMAGLTTRQRYETEHVSPGTSCAICHARFDPIGFGLEHFDEGGRYRTTDNSLPIDTVSDVPAPGAMTSAPTPLFQFQDEETLAQGLAAQPIVYQCFAAYLTTYAFGTGTPCLGASNVADFQAGKLGIAEYLVNLAAEPNFSKRAAQ
jgi:hypothetical protein